MEVTRTSYTFLDGAMNCATLGFVSVHTSSLDYFGRENMAWRFLLHAVAFTRFPFTLLLSAASFGGVLAAVFMFS